MMTGVQLYSSILFLRFGLLCVYLRYLPRVEVTSGKGGEKPRNMYFESTLEG